MNSDVETVYDKLKSSGYVSGPWRCTMWSHPKSSGSPTFIFSEEHGNEGSCPNETSVTTLLRDILDITGNVHVFIENFIYVDDIQNFGNKTIESSCGNQPSSGILNHMRKCFEMVKAKNSHFQHRIHFIDPRVDLIAILPNGKIFEAIDSYVATLASQGKYSDILLTLYEAFIHPLMNLFPDQLVMNGRLSGAIIEAKKKMTPDQLTIFESAWREDVLGNISILVEMLREMKQKKSTYTEDLVLKDVNDMKIQYRNMTNKFLDTWLLAKLFVAENNTNMSASVMYLGSLHSLHMESYFQKMGYQMVDIFENKNLTSCLNFNK